MNDRMSQTDDGCQGGDVRVQFSTLKAQSVFRWQVRFKKNQKKHHTSPLVRPGPNTGGIVKLSLRINIFDISAIPLLSSIH
jgi:hypothetical protein